MSVQDRFKQLIKNCRKQIDIHKQPDIWFHGTNGKAANCIMEEGFKCRKNLDNAPDFYKGMANEYDFIWFTKDSFEACEHAFGYSDGAEDNKVIMAKLSHKKSFDLTSKIKKSIYNKALKMGEEGLPVFKRLTYTFNPDDKFSTGQKFLTIISNTDIKEPDGSYRNPDYKEILGLLGFDSIIYKSFKSRGMFTKGDTDMAIGVLEENIDIIGQLWNFG